MRMPSALSVAAVLAATAGPAAATDTDEMHEFITTNDVMPLARAIDGIAGAHPGTVVEAELEEEYDAPSGWAYDVEILTAEGREIEVEMDAVSGAIIEVDD